MKLGIMNDPRLDLLEEIKWVAENGFDYIDLTIEPLRAYEVDVDHIWSALKAFNLDAIGHTNPFLPSIFPIQSIRNVCLDEFKKYIDIFARLGINDAPFLSDEDKIKANISFLRKITRLCKPRGITLMFENYIAPFDSPKVFERILREVPELKIHLDVGHCNINQPENLTGAFFRKFGSKIVHVHLSDNKGKNDDHLPLGCGNIDWEEIIRIMKRYSFDASITLEVFSRDRDYLLLSRDKLRYWWHRVEVKKYRPKK
jgi:sugar phosphate isomerase/epimerase